MNMLKLYARMRKGKEQQIISGRKSKYIYFEKLLTILLPNVWRLFRQKSSNPWIKTKLVIHKWSNYCFGITWNVFDFATGTFYKFKFNWKLLTTDWSWTAPSRKPHFASERTYSLLITLSSSQYKLCSQRLAAAEEKKSKNSKHINFVLVFC